MDITHKLTEKFQCIKQFSAHEERQENAYDLKWGSHIHTCDHSKGGRINVTRNGTILGSIIGV